MLTTFTQFLRQNGYASVAELEEASQATVLYGGRLGTALLELGLLTPEQLDAALARHHELPPIPPEWLAKPDAAARAALHVDLVKRHRAFPLFFEKRSLHVGLVDPRNEGILDDLAFASGCLIVPYALPEFRFVQLMQRVYGVAPSNRFKALFDETARARVVRARETQRKSAAAAQAAARAELEVGPLAADLSDGADAFFVADTAPLAPVKPVAPAAPLPPAQPAIEAVPAPRVATAVGSELAALAQSPALEIDPAPVLLDRRAPLVSLEELERTLAESPERARVIEASIEIAARFAEAVALLVVRDGVAAGLAAARTRAAFDADAILIPLQEGSALFAAHAERTPQRALASHALDKLLAKALRGADDAELEVFPVAIGERVVNLLVAQALHGALAHTARASLAALAPQLAASYERLIRVQKQKARPPAAAGATTAAKAAIGALPLQKRVVRVPAKE